MLILVPTREALRRERDDDDVGVLLHPGLERAHQVAEVSGGDTRRLAEGEEGVQRALTKLPLLLLQVGVERRRELNDMLEEAQIFIEKYKYLSEDVDGVHQFVGVRGGLLFWLCRVPALAARGRSRRGSLLGLLRSEVPKTNSTF